MPAPMLLAHLYVVGMTYRDVRALASLEFEQGCSCQLEREPTNQFDKYAIKVLYDGVHVGYIPKGPNVVIANLMDAGVDVGSTITSCKQRGQIRDWSILLAVQARLVAS